MKIANIQILRIPHPWKTRIYVVAQTDDGKIGIGESTVGQVSQAVVGALRDFIPTAIGLDPHDISRLRHYVQRDVYADGGQVTAAALAGIEVACWDLVAQYAKVPVYRLLGGRTHPSMRVYANGWYRGQRDPDIVGRMAQTVMQKGYTALKIDPFGANWRSMSHKELDLSLAILRSVRSAIGDNADLIVEAHSRFDAATALSVAKKIEPLRPLWLEEPVHYTDLKAYSEVVRAGVPIAAGESLWRLSQFVELLNAAPLAVIQFDPTHVGGIAASKAIAELAGERNAMIAPHSASGLINEAACAHLVMATPHSLILERFDDFEEADPNGNLVRTSLAVSQGQATLPDEPGLGIHFDLETLVSRHTEETRKDMNLFAEGWERRGAR